MRSRLLSQLGEATTFGITAIALLTSASIFALLGHVILNPGSGPSKASNGRIEVQQKGLQSTTLQGDEGTSIDATPAGLALEVTPEAEATRIAQPTPPTQSIPLSTSTAVPVPSPTPGTQTVVVSATASNTAPGPDEQKGATTQAQPQPQPADAPVVPAILHTTQGREICTVCHAVGGAGAGAPGGTGLPAGHQGRGDSVCRACHTSEQAPPATPAAAPAVPAILHTTWGVTQCLACHQVGGKGVGTRGGSGMAPTHQGRADSTCLSCHKSSSTTLVSKGPRIEHKLDGRTDCTGCHGRTEELPKNHQGRPDGICQACHRV